MPTYRLSGRNQLRSPSGAVNEAPDGPGAMAIMNDDTDNYLGVGGAEYVANAAGLAAIPAGRRFPGKLAYQADIATTWRYVGVGATALLGNDTTHPWQAWHRPAKAWVPIVTGYTGTATILGNSQIVAGRLFLDLALAAGTGFALTAGSELGVNLGANEVTLGQFASGSGFYNPAGNSGSGTAIALAIYVVGATTGTLANALRVRVPRANSATSPQNSVLVSPSTAIGTGTATDFLAASLSGPSALVA